MSSPAENVKLQFVADGSATYSNLLQWIFSKGDISVYFDQALQDAATYSISVPTSSGYDITFSAPPLAPVVITILRRIEITDPENFSPGASLTAEDLNTRFDTSYLIEVDNKYYAENIEVTYGLQSLTYTAGSPNLPGPADIILPVLSTPGPTDAARVWGKDSTGAIVDLPLDPSGKSAAELETELASAVSPTSSGAKMVGYWDGLGATTVQDDLDLRPKYSNPPASHTILADGCETLGGTLYVSTPTPVAPDTFEVSVGDNTANYRTTVTGANVSVRTSEDFTWDQGSPTPPVAATGISDTIVATKGFVVGTTPTFTEKATSAAAEAASLADPDPLHFYFSLLS
jgi:hypothetical protein